MIHHHLGCSAFATHAVVSRRSPVKIDPALPLTEAALLGCAVLTGVGAVVNTARVTARVTAGQSVAVVGLGGVGLAAVLGAVAMTGRGGITVTAGLPPAGTALPVDIVLLVVEELTLKGSYIGTCMPARDIPRYVALYREDRLPVDRLVSEYLTLGEINEGFDRLQEGQAVRQIVRLTP